MTMIMRFPMIASLLCELLLVTGGIISTTGFVPNMDHASFQSSTSTATSTTSSSSPSRLGMFFADSVAGKNGDNNNNKDDDKSILNKNDSDETTPNTAAASTTTTVMESTTTTATLPPLPVQLVMADSEAFLNTAGTFLVDNFWLSSDHHQIENVKDISDDARTNLVIEQCSDLQEKYGQLLGSRLARSAVIAAIDEETNELVGMVTLKETLLLQQTELLDSEKAEGIAKNAVASLGPKQRQLYKNAPISTIATELLSPDSKAVCVLSNLAVSTKARRRGVANALCTEMEALASDWDFDSIHLLVERDNAAARRLYEGKLGYQEVALRESAPALRVDIESGAFIETTADTLILSKPV